MNEDLDYEARIARLIDEAYASTPAPDAAKLQAVERRVMAVSSRQGRVRNAWAGWLLLGLAATGAAAWWAGDRWREIEPSNTTTPPEVAVPLIEPAPSADAPTVSPDSATENTGRKPRTVYRREAR